MKDRYKIIIISLLVVGLGVLLSYFHVYLKKGIILSHFFYIPIVLAGFWWRKKGIWISVGLGCLLVLSSMIFLPKDLAHNCARAVIFLAVGSVVAVLSDTVDKRETELIKSNERYHALFRNIGDGVAIYEPVGDTQDFTILDFNTAGEKIDDVSKDSIVNKRVTDVFPGSFQSGLIEALQRVGNTGRAERFPLTHYENGSIVSWREYFVYKLPSGEIVSVFRDESETKKAEERIKHLNAVLRAVRNVDHLIKKETDPLKIIRGACDNLVDTRGYLNAWIITIDKEGKFAILAQTGLDHKLDAIVARLQEGVFPTCARQALSSPELIITRNPDTTCAGCLLAKQYPDMSVMTNRLEYGSDVYGVLTVTLREDHASDEEEQLLFRDLASDIAFALHSIDLEADRVRMEDALRESAQHLKTVLEGSPMPTFVIDETHSIRYWNRALEELSGRKAKDVVGYEHPWLALYSEERATLADLLVDERFDEIPELYEGKYSKSQLSDETYEAIDFFPNIGDKGKWLRSTASILRSSKGAIIGAVETVEDITDRKKFEDFLRDYTEALERSNQELEKFAYVASHDLQEPLRMVSSYMQLLSRRYRSKLDKDADEFIDFAVDGAKRMQILINDLLAYSRVGTRSREFEQVDCTAILGMALVNLFSVIEESGAVITHDTLPSIMADKIQLEQLFQNLIGNAIKFRGNKMPQVHVSALRDGDAWRFSVVDNGIGIAPPYQERIFEIFQRLHGRNEFSGTGIGLAICKKIVERHGGRIWVESEEGNGSTFSFSIPDPVESV